MKAGCGTINYSYTNYQNKKHNIPFGVNFEPCTGLMRNAVLEITHPNTQKPALYDLANEVLDKIAILKKRDDDIKIVRGYTRAQDCGLVEGDFKVMFRNTKEIKPTESFKDFRKRSGIEITFTEGVSDFLQKLNNVLDLILCIKPSKSKINSDKGISTNALKSKFNKLFGYPN